MWLRNPARRSRQVEPSADSIEIVNRRANTSHQHRRAEWEWPERASERACAAHACAQRRRGKGRGEPRSKVPGESQYVVTRDDVEGEA